MPPYLQVPWPTSGDYAVGMWHSPTPPGPAFHAVPEANTLYFEFEELDEAYNASKATGMEDGFFYAKEPTSRH